MSKAVITNNIDKFLNEINAGEVIRRDELKVDDIPIIRRMAYIASAHKRLITIAAEKFNVYAQNALLKLIEEPPKNIDFLIVTNSKYSLLDTVLSRVFLEKKLYEKENQTNIEKITNEYILNILTSDMDKNEIKEFFYSIVKNKELNESQMKILNDAVKMLELNIDKEAVLSLVMLSLKVGYENL